MMQKGFNCACHEGLRIDRWKASHDKRYLCLYSKRPTGKCALFKQSHLEYQYWVPYRGFKSYTIIEVRVFVNTLIVNATTNRRRARTLGTLT
jgi:hypothetical protein